MKLSADIHSEKRKTSSHGRDSAKVCTIKKRWKGSKEAGPGHGGIEYGSTTQHNRDEL